MFNTISKNSTVSLLSRLSFYCSFIARYGSRNTSGSAPALTASLFALGSYAKMILDDSSKLLIRLLCFWLGLSVFNLALEVNQYPGQIYELSQLLG